MKSVIKPQNKPVSKFHHKPEQCELCQRQLALTYHHLIPRKMHRRTYFRKNFDKAELAKGIWICRKCHNGVHRLYDEMTLAKKFHRLDLLLADEAIKKHVQWVAKQKDI